MAEKEGPSATGMTFGDRAQVNIYHSSLGVTAAVNPRSDGEPSTPRYSGSGVQSKKPGDMPDRIQLSRSISYFPKKKISYRVFRGEQTTATGEQRSIAVKRDISDEQILRETKMLLKLTSHQNVVGCYDSGTYNQGETLFLAMELCHPQNLRQYTETNKKSGERFDQELTKKRAKQIVAGLAHIHDAGITHRDLKPDNILFSFDQRNLKISDFGLSKEYKNKSEQASYHMDRIVTDGYRAPEILNKDLISQKVDIFSAGLVACYIWSYGEHPYGTDPHEQNFRIKNSEAPNFQSLKFEPKTEARNLLGWMLKFKPEDRPTIQQVEDDVILGGSSTAPDYIPEADRPKDNEAGINMIHVILKEVLLDFPYDQACELVEELKNLGVYTKNHLKLLSVKHIDELKALPPVWKPVLSKYIAQMTKGEPSTHQQSKSEVRPNKPENTPEFQALLRIRPKLENSAPKVQYCGVYLPHYLQRRRRQMQTPQEFQALLRIRPKLENPAPKVQYSGVYLPHYLQRRRRQMQTPQGPSAAGMTSRDGTQVNVYNSLSAADMMLGSPLLATAAVKNVEVPTRDVTPPPTSPRMHLESGTTLREMTILYGEEADEEMYDVEDPEELLKPRQRGEWTLDSSREPSTPRYSGPGAQPKKPGDIPDRIQLSDSIRYFPKKEISKRVFHGEQTTGTGEPRSIAVKMDIYDKQTLRETDMLLKLTSHQNVVGHYASGAYHQGGIMFLAMELCYPQNLRQYTEAKNGSDEPFDKKLAKTHVKQIVAGLVHIHDAGITHCDLKPDNILFSLDQKTLKISDFGLSKEFENMPEPASCFMGQFGTDGYMAPEILNKDLISQKVDIFSAGLVACYIWSYGEHPYGTDPHEQNFRIKNREAPNFQSLKFEPKTEARNLLGWMLKFKPENRPAIQQVEDDVILGGSSTAPHYIPESDDKEEKLQLVELARQREGDRQERERDHRRQELERRQRELARIRKSQIANRCKIKMKIPATVLQPPQ